MYASRNCSLTLVFHRAIFVVTIVFATSAAQAAPAPPASVQIKAARASSSQEGCPASAAIDHDRFSTASGKVWKGAMGAKCWEWQADLGEAKQIGAILQILGDEETYLAAAPLSYVWQASENGTEWRDLDATKNTAEHRMFRVFRLAQPVTARYLRLAISGTGAEPPSIREIEVYSDNQQPISFPDWVFVVSSEDSVTPETCDKYLPLARKCSGWDELNAQGVWHGDFDKEMVTAEPQPLCAFFTGSYRDWCEVDRFSWRGVEAVLKSNALPMWAACGGGQAFGILSDQGCEAPWDCPKCRDPEHPKTPIYGHIGLIDPSQPNACGIYTNNLYEKGPTPVRRLVDDPVFRGLPDEFLLVEYHCGQLEYVPTGWDLIVTKGKGGKTWMQCMRKRDTCIYAVQFHIENQGTPENSQLIMSNFLTLAKEWQSREHGSASSAARVGTSIVSPKDVDSKFEVPASN